MHTTSPVARTRRVFAVVSPGLETALVDELRAFGVLPKPTVGGAGFDAADTDLFRLHLHARVAARFRVRVGSFRATALEGLGAEVRKLPWDAFVHPRQPIEVEVVAHRSRLRHREAVAKKVEHAIRDAARVPRRSDVRRPSTEAVSVLVRIEDDVAELSVDASGDLLHRRGWRKDHAGAPLRENLAAACLWLAGWTPEEPLMDPMCGSGTFVIEAATIAAGIPPGADRTFAFQRWPTFDAPLWERVRAEKRDPAVPSLIRGSDRDDRAIVAARANAKRAGVQDRVRLELLDIDLVVPPAPKGLLIVNPPWGHRLGDATSAWEKLGNALRGPFAGWRWAVLAPRGPLPRAARLAPNPIAKLADGGLDVVLHGGGPNRPTAT